MQNIFFSAIGALAFMQVAQAHIALEYPAPFRSKLNPNVPAGNVDSVSYLLSLCSFCKKNNEHFPNSYGSCLFQKKVLIKL